MLVGAHRNYGATHQLEFIAIIGLTLSEGVFTSRVEWELAHNYKMEDLFVLRSIMFQDKLSGCITESSGLECVHLRTDFISADVELCTPDTTTTTFAPVCQLPPSSSALYLE